MKHIIYNVSKPKKQQKPHKMKKTLDKGRAWCYNTRPTTHGCLASR